MTVIAWDGKVLAADRQCTVAGLKMTTCKIFRTKLGLVGFEGNADSGTALLAWLNAGADPEKWPECQKDNDRYANTLLIGLDGRIWRYDRQPYAYQILDTFTASGSGRDYALAAMAMGKTAKEAVELACRFDNGCGNGIDEIIL